MKDETKEDKEEDHMQLVAEPVVGPSQVILHEDKKYYPSAEEVYGPEVETIVQDEDTQPLETPIIKPIRKKRWDVLEETIPETVYKTEYMVAMLDHPENVRNVVIAGHLHHGKTRLVDMFVRRTHVAYSDVTEKELRYTDARRDEQQRYITVKAKPMSFLLPNSIGKVWEWR